MEGTQRSRRREGKEAVMKKGPWSPWEDELLVEYVSKHGEGSWKEVALRSGLRRCGKSCRLRWTNQLRPHLRRDRFTPEEEATILLLHSIHGNKWAKISAQLPGRTDNSIKNFMNTRAKRQRRQAPAGTTCYNPPNVTRTTRSVQSASSSSASSRAHLTSFSSSYNTNAIDTLPQDPNYTYTSTYTWSLARSSASTGAQARSANFSQACATARVATPTPTASRNEGAAAGISCDTPPSTLLSGQLPVELPSLLWLSQEHANGSKLTNRISWQPELELDYRNSAACSHNSAGPVSRPQELPSVQYSSSRIYSDPLALLGGESISLFKDEYGHNLNLSPHTSSCADPCASRTLANLVITPSATLESTSNYSDSDYTLECIIKPLAASSTMQGVALGQQN